MYFLVVPNTDSDGIHFSNVTIKKSKNVGHQTRSGSINNDYTTYRSKCWFHLGSRDDLQVSVLWHWPEPSTLTLAKGSGSRNRSFLARFLAQSTEKEVERLLDKER